MTVNQRYAAYQALNVSVADRVATLSLNSGQRFNAVTAQMHVELAHIFQDLANDDDVNVIVLTGAGNAFCAGADLNWVKQQLDSPPTIWDARREGRGIVLGILDCPKPVIARVNGDAMGLGASLALLCDIIVAADHVRIADPHVRIGLVAGDGGALIWPALVGYARAKEFLLTGNMVTAPQAASMGLINYAVPVEQLDEKVQGFARQLADGASQAIRLTKLATNTLLRQAVDSVLEASLANECHTFHTADHAEGVSAFLERRPARFTGK